MIDQYLETQVMTASPERLHLMVVEGAIRHANLAMQAIQREEWEAMHLSLNSSRDFVSELLSGLDENRAPDLVRQLKGLFAFVLRNLMLADIERSTERTQSALKILETHRETWLQLMTSLQSARNSAADDAPQSGGLSWEG